MQTQNQPDNLGIPLQDQVRASVRDPRFEGQLFIAMGDVLKVPPERVTLLFNEATQSVYDSLLIGAFSMYPIIEHRNPLAAFVSSGVLCFAKVITDQRISHLNKLVLPGCNEDALSLLTYIAFFTTPTFIQMAFPGLTEEAAQRIVSSNRPLFTRGLIFPALLAFKGGEFGSLWNERIGNIARNWVAKNDHLTVPVRDKTELLEYLRQLYNPETGVFNDLVRYGAFHRHDKKRTPPDVVCPAKQMTKIIFERLHATFNSEGFAELI